MSRGLRKWFSSRRERRDIDTYAYKVRGHAATAYQGGAHEPPVVMLLRLIRAGHMSPRLYCIREDK